MRVSKPRPPPLLREQVSTQSIEPPYTDPYVRWCGRGEPRGLPLSRLLVGNCSWRGSYSRIRGCPHWGEELTTWEKQRESETHFVSAAQGRCISRAHRPGHGH